MRIVLKPLGVVAIVGAIILLALLAFRSRVPNSIATSETPIGGTVATGNEANPALAVGDLIVYADGLENGWMERGWAKTIDYAAAAPIRGSAGTSIRVESGPFEAVKIYNPNADLSPYKYLVLFLHGGKDGGQSLTVATVASGKTQKGVALSPLPANKWVRVVLPLSELGVQGRADVQAFWVQSAASKPTVFNIDDITFRVSPPDSVAEETLTFSATAPATTVP